MKKSDINILIIEDDKTQAASLSEAINRRGYKSVVVTKADEAESLVKIKPIHAIVCDVMLPGRNGVDLVGRLKENLADGVGILFVSGIYKDKSFAAEAIRKTDAIDFMFKPYNIEELLSKLDKKLKDYFEAPKVDLFSLLSTPFTSNRERRKALDHVEELSGFDLPFVFCILMDSESSGHLNIIDQQQNIYGVTFAKGTIVKVDSESTNLLTKKLLMQHGFVTETEFNELKNSGKSKGDIVRALVDEGLMSPHVPQIIKTEAIVNELNKLVSDARLNVNFVLDRKIKEESDSVDMQNFLPQLHDMIDRLLTAPWLKNFYVHWAGHPIRLGPQFQDHHQFKNYAILRRVEGVVELFKKEATIEEALAQSRASESDFYKALHFLALRGVVVFEEVKRVKNLDEHVNRLKSMHASLKDKDPVDIFKYFGLNNAQKAADVAKIYKEFTKSNHPDTLPQSISAEIKKLNTELFAWVTAASEVLTNDEKKAQYMNTKKQAEAEKQIKSDELVSTAAVSLSRGRYSEALPLLESAVRYYKSDRSYLHLLWAKFKVDGQVKYEDLTPIDKALKAMPQGVRQTALYIFVQGLVKKAAGNTSAAAEDFERSLHVDPNFMDARRELAAARNQKQEKGILNGDISQVISGIFKKNKGA